MSPGVLDRLHLVGRTAELVEAWEQVFDGEDRVEISRGDIFEVPADAMLSPANSFGIMDGGLDRTIRDRLGFETESRLQAKIVDEYFGELPVGAALVVETETERWPFMVSAPTMRVPEPVPTSINAYLAFRAALVAIRRHNAAAKRPIRTLACPGLATGIGRMSPRRCAGQMRVAWTQLQARPRIPSFDMIHRVHDALRTAE